MGDNGNSKLGCVWVAIVIIIFIALSSSCSDNSSKYDSNYSYEYNTNKEYQNNVNDIADIYGEDPADVDRKINDVVDAMN